MIALWKFPKTGSDKAVSVLKTIYLIDGRPMEIPKTGADKTDSIL